MNVQQAIMLLSLFYENRKKRIILLVSLIYLPFYTKQKCSILAKKNAHLSKDLCDAFRIKCIDNDV